MRRRDDQLDYGDPDGAAETSREIREVARAAGPPHKQAERR